jgi:hypothetical protein
MMADNQNEETTPIESETPIEPVIVDSDALVIRNIMPGILMILVCHMRGGRITKRENVQSREGENGEAIETWEAIRIVKDPAEMKAADKLRAKIHRAIKKLGVDTEVGLIVPATRKQELAQTLAGCSVRVKGFNSKAKSLDLVFRYTVHNIEGSNAGTIAAVTSQLHEILSQVTDAVKSDDARILEFASRAQLGEFQTAAEVMAATPAQRAAIVAKIRADLTREAIGRARSFSTLLPEEAGLAVTDMVSQIRKSATTWVKASKESDEAYQIALNAVDIDGISAMQAALVKAASMADAQVEEETAVEAGGIVLPFDVDEPEDGEGSAGGMGDDAVGMI